MKNIIVLEGWVDLASDYEGLEAGGGGGGYGGRPPATSSNEMSKTEVL